MMSFDSENAMSGTSERIDLPGRPGRINNRPGHSAYRVLENKGVEILIMVGTNGRNEMFCESYVMNSGWTTCASQPDINHFETWIVWQNQLVVKNGDTLYVYNQGEDHWSTRTNSEYRQGKFFLNAKNHLCLDGLGQVWCLKNIKSTWNRKGRTYVVQERMTLIGTLPFKIISTMAT